MSKLSVLKFSRDIGKQFSQLAFVINELSFDCKAKRELLQQTEKVRFS
ncbi:hypothetical protein [Bacillus sonorensis]|nr:hypothetical protein [Bacillus sonorensis]MCY8034114.1 hypothetical protein [Bacillus sonorensis]MEC0684964.1 hypothetical protein [Bacillus haynesii]